ncbi:PREDICTED: elongation factor 1-beta-like [Rhagoletis zephyria]|uniref:elongation factor 1-beta-like n=1 Tax=Rhagoletis zephyria TaxID=28612 RepID=UPI00081147D4|nr:PREDICTED: elongation factor 1-beta-like [Rhagoletis zephyria]
MTVEGLLAEANSVNNFRFRQVEKCPGAKANGGDGVSRPSEERVQKLEARVSELEDVVKKLSSLISNLNLSSSSKPAAVAQTESKPKQAPQPAKKTDDDDDDVDLFGSDDEVDEAAEKLKQERLAAYAAKKSKKPGTIAKSNVILDVKPWDDETNMADLEAAVRTIQMDGLVWGVSKLVPLAYGIKKLQIVCVVEDEKVSIEELSEKIESFEDFVQSVDIAAFQKI